MSEDAKKAEHTPGPWEYSDVGAQVFASDGQTHIADIRGYGALQYEGEEFACARMDADGRLMAAAPDLLAACEAWAAAEAAKWKLINSNDQMFASKCFAIAEQAEVAKKMIHTAIAKAKGE